MLKTKNAVFHTTVDVDDFLCPECVKITSAELSIDTGKYHCKRCGLDF
jgi:predicted RNA-binding Zn-ribbon protein involved in translation (DUF1610 family)